MDPDIRKCINVEDAGSAQLEIFFRMKPTRIRMCHSLVMNYGLYKRMEIFVCTTPMAYVVVDNCWIIFTASKTCHKAGNDTIPLR